MRFRDRLEPAFGLALSLLLRLINLTIRWNKINLSPLNRHWSEGNPTIMAFWHGHQLMMPWAYIPDAAKAILKPIYALISLHSDGRIAAKALSWLRIGSIDGSSTRGGARALLKLKQCLKSGVHVAVTPDGPKGPRYVAKQGAVLLSSISGSPIIPFGMASSKFWKFGSWDGMFLPKPFSRVAVIAGSPFCVLPRLNSEEILAESERLSSDLNILTRQAQTNL